MILGEKAVEDRLRRHPTRLSARNLANETTDDAVDRQTAAIMARQELMRRWHRCKAHDPDDGNTGLDLPEELIAEAERLTAAGR